MGAREEYAAKQHAAKLADLGWTEAVDVFIKAIRDVPKAQQAAIAAELFGQRKEARAINPMIQRFSVWLPGGEAKLACWQPYPEIALSLAAIGAKDAVPTLKEALSNYLSIVDVGGFAGAINSGCLNTYLASLAVLDDPAWKQFPYFYRHGGWTETRKIIIDLEAFKNGERHGGSGQDPIDESSPHASRIRDWLRRLGRYNPAFGQGFKLQSAGSYVKVRSPKVMLYYGEASDHKNIVKASYILHLRATGDPNRAWVVTDLQETTCRRCGQQARRILANIEEQPLSATQETTAAGEQPLTEDTQSLPASDRAPPTLPVGAWRGTMRSAQSASISVFMQLDSSGSGSLKARTENQECEWSLALSGKQGDKYVYKSDLRQGTGCGRSPTVFLDLRTDGSLDVEIPRPDGRPPASGILQPQRGTKD